MSKLPEIELAGLSLQDLKNLANRVEVEIAARRSTARRWLRQHTPGGLVERDVRYRNPENPTQTWSGRGEPPAWVAALIAQGTSLESLEVSDDDPTFPLPKERS